MAITPKQAEDIAKQNDEAARQVHKMIAEMHELTIDAILASGGRCTIGPIGAMFRGGPASNVTVPAEVVPILETRYRDLGWTTTIDEHGVLTIAKPTEQK